MPSPVGHALGGMAAGWLVAGVRRRGEHATRPPWLAAAMLFATLGMLPDIDFLFGVHSTYTHSIGAATIVALVAWVIARSPVARADPIAPSPLRLAAACWLAYASHILLDGLGDDTTPPIGIMALWPLTSEFYQSNLRWFMAITRRYWLRGFWTHNLLALARELLLLVPIVWVVFALRSRGRQS